MINWKLRFQNKATLVAIVTTFISFVYFAIEAFGVVPKFDQTVIVKIALSFIDLLAIIGIVVDPTTEGIADSDRAMNYGAPFSNEVAVIENDDIGDNSSVDDDDDDIDDDVDDIDDDNDIDDDDSDIDDDDVDIDDIDDIEDSEE